MYRGTDEAIRPNDQCLHGRSHFIRIRLIDWRADRRVGFVTDQRIDSPLSVERCGDNILRLLSGKRECSGKLALESSTALVVRKRLIVTYDGCPVGAQQSCASRSDELPGVGDLDNPIIQHLVHRIPS